MKLITINRVHKPQRPDIKKKVIELRIGGWLGKKFVSNLWAAFTYPLPFMVLMLFWVYPEDEVVAPLSRVHEFQHAAQDQGNLCFLVTWYKYVKALILGRIKHGSWLAAYAHNPMEIEAYAVEDAAAENGLPDWAKT